MAKRKNDNVSNAAYVYRMYPTAEQCIFFAKSFGCCRKVWNLMLNDKITYYKEQDHACFKEMLIILA